MESGTIAPLTRFLLPIDDSEASRRCVNFAGCLSAGLGSQVTNITLLHVLEGSYLGSHITNVDARVSHILKSDKFHEIMEQHVHKVIDPLMSNAEKTLRSAGSQAAIDSIVIDGDPAEQIVKTGKEGRHSTIIMGRTGSSEIKELLLGGVASSVTHRPHHMSVYIVGQKIMSDGTCLLPKILVPVDGSPCSLAALREAAILGKCYGKELHKIMLLHVIDLARYSEQTEKGAQPEREGEALLEEARTLLLKAGISDEKLETIAEYGKPATVILKIAAAREVTLIMMSRQGRSALKDFFVGSVTSDIINRCTEPTVALVCGAEEKKE